MICAVQKNKSKEKTRQVKKREVESGSDSEDDKYKVHKKDDESVDDSASDIGWNSDDEVAFDSRRKRGGDDEEDEYYSDEDDMEGGMLLSDMLDMPKKTSSKSSAAAVAVTTVNDEPDSEAEAGSDEDDEESQMYSDDDESESELEEEYSEEAHSKLLKSIDKFSKSADGQLLKSKSNANQNAKESTFSAMLDGSVSMNALLGALENTQDLSAVRQQLTELTKSSAAPLFVDKVVSDRAERDQAYSDVRQDMGKWQETVVSNRHKRVLDLAGDRRALPTTKQLVSKFSPSTAMEREIQMVLVKHGTSDAAAAELEGDELQARQGLSEKEVRERQGELAKIKALMFYEQMKRHRLNKIKSKAYRTIQKRQRRREQQRLRGAAGEGGEEQREDSDDDQEEGTGGGMSEEQREQAAYERVKERMDMRHSSTSKWSKMALKQGQMGDKNRRAAYHEAVLLGHELTAKMTEETAGAGSRKRKSEGEDREVYRGKGGKGVSEDAAGEMQQILSGEGAEGVKVEGRYSKLFDMDFMKKAANQQRERSREEAEAMLKEIEMMENGDDSDDEGRTTAKTAAMTAGVAVKRKRDPLEEQRLSEARKEMSDALGREGLSLGGGKRGKSGVTSALVLSTPVDLTTATATGSFQSGEEANPWLMPAASAAAPLKSGAAAGAVGSSVAAAGAAKGKNVVNNNNNNNNSGKGRSTNTMVKIAHNPTSTTTAAAPPAPAAPAAGGKLPARAPLLMQKSQADLVKIAFSGPDYEADFDQYRNKQIDLELGTADKTAEVIKNGKQ